ncbi:MAG: CBS domain-containing protein, partial [bacterium]|nr:CBS domain-containing protein [bacterium]
GVFRSTPGRDGKFLEANPAALRLLGFQKEEELYKITVFDLFHAKEDRIKIMKELLEAGFIKKRMLQWKRADGSVLPISISVVLVKDENGIDRYCDGIIEDVTDRKKNDEERENLIIELQTAQLFYNRSIKHFLGDITTCSMNQSIHKAAAIMSRNKCSAILITAESDRFIGIVTDYDLRERVVAENIDLNRPVSEIMSAPIVTIPDSGLIFEAMLLMQEKGVRHLAVKSHSGEIVSLISNAQLFHMQRSSSSFLIREIHEAGEVEEIITTHNRLPRLVKALIDTGSNSKNICRIITAVSDAIVERLIQFAIDEMGPPPAKFAFVALGSEGREEQTLFTDQDNAIIYEDLAEPEAEAAARDYFLKLGEKVCLWLDKCGYRLCEGEIMANNPKWCQPLSKWKAHFSKWINTANPQDLLEINIFFDFRPVYGSREFTKELRAYIDTLIAATPAFLQYIARNALLYKPPLGFFGKIVVESSGENPSTFDIKDSMKPIVNFARIYVLKNNINETNTQQRLHRLYTENILNKSSYDEIVKVYDYLMQMRFKHQAKALSENREPDNFINPGKLTDIEHSLVKNTFSQINNFQKRLSYDFTGTA